MVKIYALSILLSFTSQAEELMGFKQSTFAQKSSLTFLPDFIPEAGMLNYSLQTGDCKNSTVDTFSESLKRNVTSLNAPALQLHCEAVDQSATKKKLSPELCLNFAGCFKSKMSSSKEFLELKINANEQVAQEAIALAAKNGMNQMLNFEKLRLYAVSKYGTDILPAECKNLETFKIPQFNPGSTSLKCKSDTIDKGYDLLQSTCRIPDVVCYSDYKDYASNRKKENKTKNIASDFLNMKVQNELDEMEPFDTQVLVSISQTMADDSKRFEARGKEIIEYMTNNYQKLDPVFKNYLKASISAHDQKIPDSFAASLLGYMQSNGHKASTEIFVDLENLRMSEAKATLQKECKTAMTMGTMCTVAHDVIAGSAIEVDSNDFFNMLSRADSITGAESTNRYLAKNVARCNTFSLSLSGLQNIKSVSLSNNLNLFSDNNDFIRNDFSSPHVESDGTDQRNKIKIGTDGSLVKTYKDLPTLMDKLNAAPDEKSSESILVKKFSQNLALPEVYNREAIVKNNQNLIHDIFKKDLTSVATDSSKTGSEVANKPSINENEGIHHAATPTISANSIGRSLIPNFDSNTLVEQSLPNIDSSHSKITGGGTDKSSYSDLTDKISSLESRLTKLKKEDSTLNNKDNRDGSTSFAEVKNTITNEIETAKSELNAIKKEQVKIDLEKSTLSITSRESKEASIKGVDVGRDNVGSSEGAQNSNYSSEDSKVNSRNGAGSSRGDNASFTPSFSGGASDVSSGFRDVTSDVVSKGESLVLLKSDGTSSVSSEQISALISERSGKAFLIEENGIIQQIIPVVENGKVKLDEKGSPLYTKVAKGNSKAFQKMIEDKMDKISKPESAADVKRLDDNLFRPILRYQDFKKNIQIH